MDANPQTHVGRRSFLRRATLAAVALPALPLGVLELAGCASGEGVEESARANDVCAQCFLRDAPAELSSRAEMIPKGEPGEPLLLSGTIYEADGRTPARNVLLYVYNTDARGLYRSRAGEHEHGRLRGWVRTGDDGRYEFRTIRPAAYPGGGNPPHVHAMVGDAEHRRHWPAMYWFEGDPYLPENQRTASERFGPVVRLTRDDSGLWRGARDIRLGAATS